MGLDAVGRLFPGIEGSRTPAHRVAAKVLLVTPDAALGSGVRRVLESRGYAVTCAPHSGHALLACLAGDVFDVAFIEAALEDMTGAALADKLRRHHPELRVLFLAAPGTANAPGVMVRPFTPRDLLAELDGLTSPPAS